MVSIKIKVFLLSIFLSLGYSSICQNKTRFPLWYIPDKDTRIDGIAIGPFTSWIDDNPTTRVNGFRLELIGWGIFLPLSPNHPFLYHEKGSTILRENNLKNESISFCSGISFSLFGTSQSNDRINGIQISGICSCVEKVNGFSISSLANLAETTNGVSIGLFYNSSINTTGLQITIIENDSYFVTGVQIGLHNRTEIMRGIQIGLWNRSNSLKGIQIGLWNKNQKRSLPLINWNF